jgi:hypothetical protein
MLLAHHARTHLARAVQRLGVAFVQTDRAFADLLQPVVVEFDLFIELVPGPLLRLGSFSARWRR